MSLLRKILTKFNGLAYRQEYLCLAKETMTQPLHVYVVSGNMVMRDVSTGHLFVGYSPLIMALPASTSEDAEPTAVLDLVFCSTPCEPGTVLKKREELARLSLKLIRSQAFNGGTIGYYEGVHGEHRFLSRFHQTIGGWYNRLYNKQTGNVYLTDNLYKQVQIAYALPRVISLITVAGNEGYNLFPTDLHGPVGDAHYLISLRHEGKACKQVASAGCITLSQLRHTFYKTAYALGKNHMQDPKPKGSFPFSALVSGLLYLPLPESALFFQELELIDTFDHGVHLLMLFKVLSQKTLNPERSTLSHIHAVYASWRRARKQVTDYLMR